MSNLYVTATEFSNWPTGLDLSDLVPDGTTAQQTAQLAVVVESASSYVEQITYQPLYARDATETFADARADGSGRLQVRLRSFPCTSILAAQWMRYSAAGWSSIPLSSVHIWGALQQNYFADDRDYRVYSGWGNPPLTVVTQYVAGYANGLLTAAATAGADTITVDNATGMTGSSIVGAITLPGTQLTIYDITGGQETVTVDSVSGDTVTLASPLQYAHAVGVRVSALPPAITTAAIYLCSWMVKERRAGGGITMDGHLQPMALHESEDVQLAKALLQPYKRVV